MDAKVEKIDQEHSKALLYMSLQKWQLKLQTRQHEYAKIGQRHDTYLLQISIMKWVGKAKAAQVIKWKDDMRKRMSLIKAKRDERILEDMWMVSAAPLALFQPQTNFILEMETNASRGSCRNTLRAKLGLADAYIMEKRAL